MTQQPGNASSAEANTQNAQISLMVFPYDTPSALFAGLLPAAVGYDL